MPRYQPPALLCFEGTTGAISNFRKRAKMGCYYTTCIMHKPLSEGMLMPEVGLGNGGARGDHARMPITRG